MAKPNCKKCIHNSLVKHGKWIWKPPMKHKLLICIRTIMLFALLSISGGPAIWLIAKFIDMLGLLGWAVCKWMDDLDRRK